MQDLKIGDRKKMKYLKMHDLKMKDQVPGHDSSGPEMRDHRNMTGNWRTSWRKRLQDCKQTRLGTTRASQVRN